ncbi:hypothetical protein L204_105322 [Cryptococcus depauperatus]
MQVLRRDYQGPLGQILFVKDKVATIAFSEQLKYNGRWEDERHHTLIFDQHRISLFALKSAIHGLLATLRVQFEQDVLLGIDLSRFPIPSHEDRVSDNINDTSPFYNFITDKNNRIWFQDSSHRFIQEVARSTELSKRFVTSIQDSAIHYNQVELQRWLGQTASFIQILMTLCHLLYGGLPRRPEMVGMKIQNSVSGLRNIFHVSGRLFLVFHYHKSQSFTNKEKWVARMLPLELGDIMMRYLAYVRPMELLFLHALGNEEGRAAHEEYLWVESGKRILESRFSSIFTSTLELQLSCPFNLSTWRHAIVAITEEFKVVLLDDERDGTGEELYERTIQVSHDQSGHTAITARRFYARIEENAQKSTNGMFLTYGRCSQNYQRIWGIQDPPIGQYTMTEKDEEWERHAQLIKASLNRSENHYLYERIDRLENKLENITTLLTNCINNILPQSQPSQLFPTPLTPQTEKYSDVETVEDVFGDRCHGLCDEQPNCYSSPVTPAEMERCSTVESGVYN